MRCAAIVLALMLLPSVSALNITDVRIMPQKPSALGGVLVVVETDDADTSRLLWSMPEVSDLGSGSLIKVKERRYFCFFSKEANSLCGFPPFLTTTFGREPYSMTLKAVGTSQSSSAAKSVHVGNLPLKPRINVTDRRVKVRVGTGSYTPDQVEYETYDSGMERIDSASGAMPFSIDTGYEASFELPEGEYYIVFSAKSEGNFGGEAIRLAVGGKAEDYPLYSKASWLDVFRPGEAKSREDLTITNRQGRNYTNLSVAVPDHLAKYMSITLRNTTISPQGSIGYTLKIMGLEGSLDAKGRAFIRSNTTREGYRDVGYIDLNIAISLISGGSPPQGSQGIISVRPPYWFGSITLAGADSMKFTIDNPTNAELNNIVAVPSGGLAGILTVSTPLPVPAGGTGEIAVKANPKTVGAIEGMINIETSAGSLKIPVGLMVGTDVSEDIAATKGDFENLRGDVTDKKYEEILADIESAIKDAESRQAADPNGARESIASARARMDVVQKITEKSTKSPTPTETETETPEPTDKPKPPEDGLPLIEIGVVVIIILVIALVVLKFRKKGWGGDIGETY